MRQNERQKEHQHTTGGHEDKGRITQRLGDLAPTASARSRSAASTSSTWSSEPEASPTRTIATYIGVKMSDDATKRRQRSRRQERANEPRTTGRSRPMSRSPASSSRPSLTRAPARNSSARSLRKDGYVLGSRLTEQTEAAPRRGFFTARFSIRTSPMSRSGARLRWPVGRRSPLRPIRRCRYGAIAVVRHDLTALS